MRGVIEHRGRKRQINDFRNLIFNKITPTDIDGFLDFGNKIFILFEIKYLDTELPTGQRLALERICDSGTRDKKHSYLIITSHDIDDINLDVDVSKTIVKEIRYDLRYHDIKKVITLGGAIRYILHKHGGDKWLEAG